MQNVTGNNKLRLDLMITSLTVKSTNVIKVGGVSSMATAPEQRPKEKIRSILCRKINFD